MNIYGGGGGGGGSEGGGDWGESRGRRDWGRFHTCQNRESLNRPFSGTVNFLVLGGTSDTRGRTPSFAFPLGVVCLLAVLMEGVTNSP